MKKLFSFIIMLLIFSVVSVANADRIKILGTEIWDTDSDDKIDSGFLSLGANLDAWSLLATSDKENAITDGSIGDGFVNGADLDNTVKWATQSVTTDADPYTLTPTAGYREVRVLLTVHADNVDVVLSETGAVDQGIVTIISQSANTAIFTTDGTGAIQQVGGTINLEQYNAITFQYMTDRWICVGHDTDGLIVSELQIPNSDDPNVDAAGEISWDTDGWLRSYDGTNQVAVGRKIETIQATIIKPNDLADAQRDLFPIWSNSSGMSFVVTKIEVWADVDNSVVTVNEYLQSDFSSANATIEASVDSGTTGTTVSYVAVTAIDNATVEDTRVIALDFDNDDVPGYVKITISGYYNADVN